MQHQIMDCYTTDEIPLELTISIDRVLTQGSARRGSAAETRRSECRPGGQSDHGVAFRRVHEFWSVS